MRCLEQPEARVQLHVGAIAARRAMTHLSYRCQIRRSCAPVTRAPQRNYTTRRHMHPLAVQVLTLSKSGRELLRDLIAHDLGVPVMDRNRGRRFLPQQKVGE